MDIFRPQTLIKEGRIVKIADIDPTKSYAQLGVFQEGNRQRGAANADTYKSYVIPLSELLSPPTNTKSYASFGDKGLQTTSINVATSIEVANSLPYNTPDITATVDGGGKRSVINFATAGVYNFELIIQALRSTVGASNENMRVWLRQNTVDVPTTTKVVNFSRFPEESETIISLSYYVQVAAGDKVQIMWSVSDKFIEITPIGGNSAQPNPDAYPAGDCVTLNINKIS